eukprot:TRINITY_DN378_c0_g1_i1.p1 TRINITY_DN378_c0_g1~~TRINITY_DN378_c0_g1_i1.p1  ORF type:complete len:221 (-),score=3.71 TRINITY_DN378_c0_g1_i1:466-1128(-)
MCTSDRHCPGMEKCRGSRCVSYAEEELGGSMCTSDRHCPGMEKCRGSRCVSYAEEAVGCSLSELSKCDTAWAHSGFGGYCGSSYYQRDADDICKQHGRDGPAVGYIRINYDVNFCCGEQGNCHHGYSPNWLYEHGHRDASDPNGCLGEYRVAGNNRGACSDICIEKHGKGTMYNYMYQGTCRCYTPEQGTRIWNDLNDDNIFRSLSGVNAWTFCIVPFNP